MLGSAHAQPFGRKFALLTATALLAATLAGCSTGPSRETTGSIPRNAKPVTDMNAGELARAAESVGKAYEKNPKDRQAGLNYANLLRMTGRNDQALAVMQQVAIFHPTDREVLAAMDPFENTMLLTTLHWPDEIRSPKELDLPDEEFDFKPAELQMAEQLVEAMTDEFDPSKYKDEYREALLQVIQAKIDGVEIKEPEPVEESANLVDLIDLLEAHPEIRCHVGRAELERMLDPANYLGQSGVMVDRVLERMATPAA